MDYEPQLIFRKPAIADELARTAARCRYIHRSTPAYTLVAIAFLVDGKTIVLDPRLAERDVEFDEDPLIQTAVSALKIQGYPGHHLPEELELCSPAWFRIRAVFVRRGSGTTPVSTRR
ncbi:hypothetical protein [Sediminimonas qiaohouensis]|uniref:hypothetical protein n=1 Tax=Sediminimonas qiaohouensis TaxID=552061 RepID=UPI0012ED8CED|nr:hypothetical protein [Sediminimonas qiaohouensis]